MHDGMRVAMIDGHDYLIDRLLRLPLAVVLFLHDSVEQFATYESSEGAVSEEAVSSERAVREQ